MPKPNKHYKRYKSRHPIPDDAPFHTPRLAANILVVLLDHLRPDTLLAFAGTNHFYRVHVANIMYSRLRNPPKNLVVPYNFGSATKCINQFANQFGYKLSKICEQCEGRAPFAHPFSRGPQPTYLCMMCANITPRTRILVREEALKLGLDADDFNYVLHFLQGPKILLSHEDTIRFMKRNYTDGPTKDTMAIHLKKWQEFRNLVMRLMENIAPMSRLERNFVRVNTVRYGFDMVREGFSGKRLVQRPLPEIIKDLDKALCNARKSRMAAKKKLDGLDIAMVQDIPILFRDEVESHGS
ncbi:hypothetical protein BC936DRAFT_147131 [Jimgerdemannia flammicorona]|uniref:Uncharacterized protein n=1 Tax=Jimgerdemannia flammicorona TaxID=994334 RepID=A0A433D624_9FUNG|nr:hypothetical protein BC936DRAFT_147131 [Jimgerdemannia flammicorona]